jgi:predicted ribosome quality control (RQC) complex YloA/Tae2 family protein
MIQELLFIEETNKEHTIYIGRNANENDSLIKNSSQNDIWFHLDDISSPHIVLQTFGCNIPKRYINYIGTLFPKYKTKVGKRYTVIYTYVKNITLTDKKGSVLTKKIDKIKY